MENSTKAVIVVLVLFLLVAGGVSTAIYLLTRSKAKDTEKSKTCVPDCDGKTCGPNKCDGNCEPGCGTGKICNSTGNCEVKVGQKDMEKYKTCIPDCDGKTCGPNKCGGNCEPGCTLGSSCNSTGNCEVAVEQKYKIKIKAEGKNCKLEQDTSLHLGLTKNIIPKVDNKVDTVWTLDAFGYLYTIVNNTKVYLSSKRLKITGENFWIYENITQDKSQALKLDKKSILRNNYDPLFFPVLYKEVLAGGGIRQEVGKGTCKGYLHFIFEKVPTS